MERQAKHRFLWSLPQPIVVFGSMLLTASAFTYHWIEPTLLIGVMLFVGILGLMLLERVWPKREDWLLDWRDVATDAFWVLTIYLIWAPIFSTYYDSPISYLFYYLRELSGFPSRLSAYSITGVMVMAFIGIFMIELIGYWIHRLQHKFMLLWRMHATHHHITKMSVARTDRTHPLELLGLNLGSIVVLAFMGASPNVVAVIVTFRLVSAHINHANLPLTSGMFGWLFTTPESHQLHHSLDYKQSNTNFGCTVILWDRLFGTFSDNKVGRVGNGSGRSLSLMTQLSLPFYSNKSLKKL